MRAQRHDLKLWTRQCLGLVVLALGCNALIDNELPTLAPNGAEGGDSQGGAAQAGASQGGGAAESGAAETAAESGGNVSFADAGEAGALGEGGAVGGTSDGVGGSSGFGGRSGSGGGGSSGTPDPCVSAPECAPGEQGSDTVSCDACNTGKAPRTRTCSADCTWGPWSTPGACQSTEECDPGTKSAAREVACPCGGKKTQQRTCSATCQWGGWTDTSTCDLNCCAEVVFCNSKQNMAAAAEFPGRGTWCRRRTEGGSCSNAEALADCMQNVADNCPNGVVPEFHIDY